MGLSLRNIGKSITDVLGGVERQINTFDHGATYSNPHPQAAPADVVNNIRNARYGPLAGNPSLQDQFLNGNRPKPFNLPAAAASSLVSATGKVGTDVLHGVTRAVPELATLATHKDFTPHPGWQQAVFGKEPVQTFTEREKGIQKNLQGKGGLLEHLATPLAIAGTGANIGLDAASFVPVGKVVEAGAKAGIPAAEKAVAQRTLLNETGAVGKNVTKPKLTVKEAKDTQAQLTQLQGKAYVEGRPLTRGESVKEGILMEKLHGKPTVTARPAPKPIVTRTNKVTVPVTPLQKESPYAWTLPITSRLEKMGGSARDLATAITNKRNIAEKGYAMAKFDSPTANSLGKEDFAKAVDHLEGTVKSKDPQVIQAASEMQQQFNKVHALAQGLGKDVKFRQNYFPHFNDNIPKKGDGGYEAAIQHLITTKQAKSSGEAAKLLDFSRAQGGQKKFASFEKQRTADLPGYPKTQGAYHHYLEQAYGQIGHYHQFGPKDEKLKQLLTNIHDQGGDLQKVTDLFNRADSRKLYDPTHEKISSALTTFQGATKLGTSFLGNAAQQGNNIVAGGLGRTIKSAVKGAFSQEERDFVRKTGVTGEGVAREAIESRGTTGTVRKITAPFFEPVEKTNRAVGALTGRDQARTIAGRLAKARAAGNTDKATKLESQLRDKFNIQGKIGDKLTLNQELDAARKFVERTQFRTGAQDLPVGATSPLGRVVTQFKRYPYKQTGFIGKEIIKPLVKEGNPLPLVRAVGVGLPAGYGANAIRNKITGRDTSNDSTITKVADAAQAGGVAGLETSTVKGLSPGGTKSADAYVSKAAKTVGGPTTSDAVNLTKAGFTAATGKGKGNDPSRFTALERVAVSHVPDAGPSISNRALPYKKADGTNVNAPTDPNKTLTADQRIKLAFTSPEDKKFLAMNTADKREAARTDPNMREIYKEWQAAKTAFTAPKLYNEGLDPQSTSVLNRDDRLTAEGRKVVANRDNGYEYTVALAKYNNNVLDPNWTDAKDIRAQQDLAKKKVGTGFEKNTRDIYGLSKQEIYDYITSNPNGNHIADELNKYDQALLAAGLISKAKFKNGFNPASTGYGSGSRRRSTASGMEDTYKYAISTKATGSSLKKPTVTARTGRVPSLKPRGFVALKTRTAVTLKKSKV